jgi:hypothetical protein
MATSRSFTLYKSRRQIGGEPVTRFEDALTEEALGRPTLSIHELTTHQTFQARLFIDSPTPSPPGWLDFLRAGFGDVPVKESTANSAVLMVRLVRRGQPEFFAFTYGFGRFLLRPDGYERSFGLRVALNTLYEADDPAAIEAPVRVRRVDAKIWTPSTAMDSSKSWTSRRSAPDIGSKLWMRRARRSTDGPSSNASTERSGRTGSRSTCSLEATSSRSLPATCASSTPTSSRSRSGRSRFPLQRSRKRRGRTTRESLQPPATI